MIKHLTFTEQVCYSVHFTACGFSNNTPAGSILINYKLLPIQGKSLQAFHNTSLTNFHPETECPAFAVEGSTQESWTASPTGTTVTIECAADHILVGSATLTCQEGGSWSSDIPQCHKLGKIINHIASAIFTS